MMTHERLGNVIPISGRNGHISEMPEFDRRTPPDPINRNDTLLIFLIGCTIGAGLGAYIGWFILGGL